MQKLKSIISQYFVAIMLAALLMPLLSIAESIYYFDPIYLIFTLIAIGLISFYYLATHYNAWLTSLSFTINFIIWAAEQVLLEKTFEDSFFYNDRDMDIMVLMLGGFLWATNKILLDILFIKCGAKAHLNWIDEYFEKYQRIIKR